MDDLWEPLFVLIKQDRVRRERDRMGNVPLRRRRRNLGFVASLNASSDATRSISLVANILRGFYRGEGNI